MVGQKSHVLDPPDQIPQYERRGLLVEFEHTFDEPGVYPYYCEPHGYPALPGLPAEAIDDASHDGETLPPNLLGMRGAVIVTGRRGERR